MGFGGINSSTSLNTVCFLYILIITIHSVVLTLHLVVLTLHLVVLTWDLVVLISHLVVSKWDFGGTNFCTSLSIEFLLYSIYASTIFRKSCPNAFFFLCRSSSSGYRLMSSPKFFIFLLSAR